MFGGWVVSPTQHHQTTRVTFSICLWSVLHGHTNTQTHRNDVFRFLKSRKLLDHHRQSNIYLILLLIYFIFERQTEQRTNARSSNLFRACSLGIWKGVGWGLGGTIGRFNNGYFQLTQCLFAFTVCYQLGEPSSGVSLVKKLNIIMV